MSRLTRDGTTKPVSRNQILRREWGQCSADHKEDWQLYPVDLYSAICDDDTCIHIYCSVYPQLPPVIGAHWGCCGHAPGIYFPRPLGFGGCSTHATPCSVPGCSCVQSISATLCEENIMFWDVSGIGTDVIVSRVISFSGCTL